MEDTEEFVEGEDEEFELEDDEVSVEENEFRRYRGKYYNLLENYSTKRYAFSDSRGRVIAADANYYNLALYRRISQFRDLKYWVYMV